MKGSLSCVMAIKRNMPHIAMIIVQSIFAGYALFSKAAISHGMNPYVFVFYRQTFATLSLAPFTFFFERNTSARLSWTVLCKIFFATLFGMTLSLNLYCYSINYTSPTYAAAATNLVPGITFVMAVLLRMESIGIKQWSGMVKVVGFIVSVCGALVFAFIKGPFLTFITRNQDYKNETHSTSMEHSSEGNFIKGPLIMLAANTAWSFWIVIQAPLVKQYPAKLRLVTLQSLCSCIQAAVWVIVTERKISSWKLGWDVNLLSVAYCGVIVTGVSHWLRVWVIEKKGPVFTAMSTPLALIITAIFSVILWKEIFHLGSVLGATLLAGGLYIVLWGKKKEAELKAIKQKLTQPKEETALQSITHQ